MRDEAGEVARLIDDLNKKRDRFKVLTARSRELYGVLEDVMGTKESAIVLGTQTPSLAQRRARLEQFSALVSQANNSYTKRREAFAQSVSAPTASRLPLLPAFDPTDGNFRADLKMPRPLGIDWDEVTRERLRAIGG
jgi:hypothetical protein